MKYFIDIDNTICKTDGSYENAKPLPERIKKVNQLYEEGHYITYWTGRGCKTGVDYKDLTRQQLERWGAKFHDILGSKPMYDVYIDDKSYNVDLLWGREEPKVLKITKPSKIEKGWGYELLIYNSPEYCGKILHFNTGAQSSMHFHIKKKETWYIQSGKYIFNWINTDNADVVVQELNVGDVVTNERGEPHQIKCIEEGDIFEVSTEHFDTDSYRVAKGDSQR